MISPKVSRMLMAVYLAAVGVLCFGDFSSAGFEPPALILGVPVDKVIHFAMYLPFVPLFLCSFRNEEHGLAIAFSGLLIAAAIGGAVEIAQGATDYRSCDIHDFVADCAGALAGFLISLIVLYSNKKRYEEKV